MKREEKLRNLANSIINLRSEYTNITIWEEYIKTFELCKDTVMFFKRSKKTTNEELIVLKKLTDELLKLGGSCDNSTIRSYKRNRVSKLKDEIKINIEKLPLVEEKSAQIDTVDSWIKSLKIFKLHNGHLSSEYHQTCYEVYQNIRKIILTKDPSDYKRIYIGRVVEKLEMEKNNLPEHINLQVEYYELTELMRLIKDNPDFNYKLMPFKYQRSLINDRFERQEWKNNLLLLVKNAKNA